MNALKSSSERVIRKSYQQKLFCLGSYYYVVFLDSNETLLAKLNGQVLSVTPMPLQYHRSPFPAQVSGEIGSL